MTKSQFRALLDRTGERNLSEIARQVKRTPQYLCQIRNGRFIPTDVLVRDILTAYPQARE